jgi:putrescine importer
VTGAAPVSAAPALRRTLTVWDLVFYGIVLVRPVAPMGMFGAVSQEARGHVITTILIGMVAMRLTALSYGRMAAAHPSAGSAFTYVGRVLHPAAGYVTLAAGVEHRAAKAAGLQARG